ncbi:MULTISPECIES: sensor histidine kinase [Paenibacillus]|uniref:Heme sensor protein HssS n=1 Tax=Paenibacillus pabuli TaxID=1472 RepID=A0A855XJW6_9BACL|nr:MULTISPECIES: HAMP domain-containing sensor histidine kinase [Paenibacillus]PWW32705.1 HAMP domain-containing protein [Paenibacillus pabuli]PXV98346.1 HAMP domain-containing protein [Paenibacillus taichungensis]
MKSIYIRVVVTFLGITLMSMLITFLVLRILFSNYFVLKIQADTLNAGKQIVNYITEKQIQDINGYMESVIAVSKYKLSLYKSDLTSLNPNHSIEQKDIYEVLHGSLYQSNNNAAVIGLPLSIDGETYALFADFHIESYLKNYNQIVLTALVLCLIIGSLLIFVASRYLVRPIKMLTKATKKIAAGNYHVNVQVKYKDELGILSDSFNQMVRKLRKIEQMRQEFVSNVSHEIQSPLTSIRGFSTTLLQNDIPDADRKRYLSIIANESERLSRLSEDLLKLASLESEHHPFKPVFFRLDEQLRRTVISTEPLWSKKKLDIDLDMQEILVNADEDQLAQVWTNLLTNAIKFTPSGGRISISLTKCGNESTIRITDTGIGIADEDALLIFQRFYKSDKARNRSQEGSGLGLAIVQKIIALHQGQIDVQSQLNHGTIISVTLPDHDR